jgi:anti-repressor protein
MNEPTATTTDLFEGNDVRRVMIEGDPWWVAADICRVLGLGNPTEALRPLDQDEKMGLRINEGGSLSNIVNEPGLYSLIIRSRKPEAKKFKRWITHEILPSIRKTGAYTVKKKTGAQAAAEAIKLLLDENHDLVEENGLLVRRIEEDRPHVEFSKAVDECTGGLSMRAMAQLLANSGHKIGQNLLINFLRYKSIYLPNTNLVYQKYIDSGHFATGMKTKHEKERPYCVALPKGEKLITKLVQEEYDEWYKNGKPKRSEDEIEVIPFTEDGMEHFD